MVRFGFCFFKFRFPVSSFFPPLPLFLCVSKVLGLLFGCLLCSSVFQRFWYVLPSPFGGIQAQWGNHQATRAECSPETAPVSGQGCHDYAAGTKRKPRAAARRWSDCVSRACRLASYCWTPRSTQACPCVNIL